MRVNSGTIANAAVTLACLMILAVGTMQVMDRRASSTTPARTPQRKPPGFEAVSPGILSIDKAHLQGASGIPTVLIEVSDFQCPFCVRYANDTYKSIKKEFVDSGKVQYALMHLPLPIHPLAQQASEAVECAGAQGQYWQMRDALFALAGQIGTKEIQRQADILKIQPGQFQSCLRGDMAEKIRRSVSELRAFGISSTPTFLLGERQADGAVSVSRRMLGAPPFDQFRAALQNALADTTAAR
jgi:protein-disulfide isomerase